MSSHLLKVTGAAAIAAVLALSSQAFAQEAQDRERRIKRRKERLGRPPGKKENLKKKTRQLEERLRQLGAGPAATAPQQGGPPPVQTGAGYGQPAQGGYPQQ